MNASATQATEIWPLVAYFFLVVTLVGGVMALSYIIGERHRSKAQRMSHLKAVLSPSALRACACPPNSTWSVFFVIFDVEAVFLFGWAVAFRELGWPGYIEAVIFIAILAAALSYLWRLGALDWGPKRHSAGKFAEESRSPKLRDPNHAVVSK